MRNVRFRPSLYSVLFLASVSLPPAAGAAEPPKWYFNYSFASKGVLAYYPLDGDPNDYSGNNLHGAPYYCIVSNAGRFGQCYDFTGIVGSSSSRIVLARHPDVTAFSLSMWVRVDQYLPYEYPDRECVAFYDRRQDYADIVMTASNAHESRANGELQFSHLRGSYQPSNHAECTSPTLTTGIWHHLVGTTDAIYTRLYLDGVLVSENVSGGALYWGGIYMGTFLGVQGSLPEDLYRSALDGQIDEVALFRRTLSQDEVKALGSDRDRNGIADFWVAPNLKTPVVCDVWPLY